MELNRRSFVTGALATGALAVGGALAGTSLTGCSTNTSSTASESEAWDVQPNSVADKVTETKDCDVVVVGAGNAGMVAALRAAELGAKVVVLEQNDHAVTWAGDIDACDSQLMKDNGVEADKEFVIKDLVRYASGKCDESLIRLWAYNSGAFVDWYQANLQSKGADVMLDTVRKEFYPKDFYFTNVYHTAYQPPLQETANHMGSEIAMPIMIELLEALGGEIVYLSTALELVQEERTDEVPGKVTGVIAVSDSDDVYTQYNATKGVMLATGGFLGNIDMMDEWGLVAHKYCSNHSGGSGRNGDGIRMATWAGATRDQLVEGSLLIFDCGCITADENNGNIGTTGGGSENFWWPGSQPFLRVNSLGQRYSNEDNAYDFSFFQAMQQPGGYWWQVFDDSAWEDIERFGTTICSRLVAKEGAKNCILLNQFYPVTSDDEWREIYLDPNVENGNVLKCDTLDALADVMGFDETAKANFLATTARYNELAAAGQDTDFGKAPWRLSGLDQDPFYAAKMSGWALGTVCGVRVNDKMQALTSSGQAIEGLYMAGLDVGGFFNGNYPQFYGGLCMGRCTTLAWLGAHAMMGQEYPVPVESAQLAY